MVIGKRGSILVITLWTLSFLAVFAVGLARIVSGQLTLAAHLQDRLKAYYLATAGIERAIAVLEADQTEDFDSLDEEWANSEALFKQVPLNEGLVTVSYGLAREVAAGQDDQQTEETPSSTLYGVMDAGNRININKASAKMLQTMLENTGGVDTEEAADIANAIVDWRDKDSVVSPGGAEEPYYAGLDEPYPCKNGDFQILEELLLVKGMAPQIFTSIKDAITIYGDGKLNINTADANDFYAFGVSSELAARIVAYRQGSDEIDGTEDDNIFEPVGSIRNIGPLFAKESEEINSLTSQNLLAVTSNVFQINSYGILEKGERTLQRKITCIVRRTKDKSPQILNWHED